MIDCILLGSGATMPSPERALSAAALRCSGRWLLLDCGEGTQLQLRRQKVSPCKIDLIALTHYHGDHIFGLPGLLQTMNCLGRAEPLFLTGPEGLEEAMTPILRLAGELNYELRFLPGGETNAVVLSDLQAHWPKGAQLQAVPTSHRVPSWGYVFTLSRPARFLPDRARSLGVPVRLWKQIASNPDAPVAVDGETLWREGHPLRGSDLLGGSRKGLRVVFSGDTQPCEALREAAQEADLLIHDATYAEDGQAGEALCWGHSTFRQAAELAAAAGVKELWLTHFSQSVRKPEDELSNAAVIFPGVRCGRDGLRVTLHFSDEA